MKRNHVFHVIALLSLLCTPSLFPAAPMEESIEITKVAGKADAITPTFVQKISNFETAKQWIQQKTNCLIFEAKECTHTDLLATHYALGFAMGAYFPIHLFAEILYSSGKARNTYILRLAQITGEFALGAIGLKGAALKPYITSIQDRLLTVFLVIADVAGLVQQTRAAPSQLFFLKTLGNYIAMNAKCVWSEAACKQSLFRSEGSLAISPFGRRLALYYWLGIASGMATRIIPFRKIAGVAGEMIGTAQEKIKQRIPTIVPVPQEF